MYKKNINKLWIVLILCIFIGMVTYFTYLFLSFWFEIPHTLSFDTPHTIIKTGFNNKEIIQMLEDKYELRIPNDAIFISGYYDNEWQDGAVHITFKIREDEIDDLFINNWERSKYLDSEEQNQYFRKYKYQGQMYTGLLCSNSIDGYTTIVFNGRFPGTPIK